MTDFKQIPFKDIVRFGQKTLLKSHLFTVSWITTRYCNYNCSYCWPHARSSVVDKKPLELYLNTMDSIKAQARANNFTDFHFSFSGGEPTANKHWWNKFVKYTTTLQRRSITASFHDEFANEQEFGDKCLALMEGGVYITINQVMVPEKFEELYQRLRRFADRGINITLKPQSNPTATAVVEGYTQEQINIMQTGFPQKIHEKELLNVELIATDGKKYYIDQAERLNAFDFNKFKGWECNAGFQSCVVKNDIVCRSYSCHDEPLGNIYDGFELFKTPKSCITHSCVSSADSKIPKKNVRI